MTDLAGRKSGRAGLMKGKIIIKKIIHQQLHQCNSSFCFPVQVCTNSGGSHCLWAAFAVSAARRGYFRAGKGNPRAVASQELRVARETAYLVMEASFWGYFFLLIGFVPPQHQLT